MFNPKLFVVSSLGLVGLLVAPAASAQAAPLGGAVDGRAGSSTSEAPLEGAVDGRVEASGAAAADADRAPATDVEPAADDDVEDDDGGGEEVEGGAAARGPRQARSRRATQRVRGGAGLAFLGAFDEAGSGRLVQVEGRLGGQIVPWFGLYAQLGLAGGEMERPGGGESRAAYATFAVIPELHPVDALAIGLGPVVMAGVRDVDQRGPRVVYANDFDRLVADDDDPVSRGGLLLRVSPAIGRTGPSGRTHAFRPSFEVAVLGTLDDVVEPEQRVMVLAGVSLGWDTW